MLTKLTRYTAERNRGRRYFLDQLTASSSTTAKRRNVKKTSGDKARQTLAMGYELLEVKEDGDEGASSFAVVGIMLGSSEE